MPDLRASLDAASAAVALRRGAARPAQVARRTCLDARWVFLNDGSVSGGILRPMHAWHLERGQEV